MRGALMRSQFVSPSAAARRPARLHLPVQPTASAANRAADAQTALAQGASRSSPASSGTTTARTISRSNGN